MTGTTAHPLLITAATHGELELLIRYSGAEILTQREFPLTYSGAIGNTVLLLAVTGMGKVNAAAAVAALLEHYHPRILVNTGCAGAYAGSNLKTGDLAVASSEFFGDEGVLTPEGWQGLDLTGIPLVTKKGHSYFNEYPLSITAAEKAVRLGLSLGASVRRGHFVTVSTCSGTAVRGEELSTRYNAVCENMEGAAVAQVALIHGIDCLEIRGISNMVEDRDLASWNIPLAVENVQRFLLKLLESELI